MRLVFFGTSHGVPEPNRHCSRGIAPDSVKGVFLTHLHGDHIDGLLQFVDLAGWFFKTVDAAILFPDERGIQALNGWFSALGYPLRPMDFRIIQPGVTFDDGILRVTACRTPSCWKSWRRARKCSSPATCAARTSISRRRFWRRTRISSSAKRRTLMPACTSRFSKAAAQRKFSSTTTASRTGAAASRPFRCLPKRWTCRSSLHPTAWRP